ncbi:MAG TPA: DUF1343 domain-containing protein [Bacilli bacterium]
MAKLKVLAGIDCLQSEARHLLKNKKIGLITNPTGIDSRFQSTIEICASLQDARLTALFACEHGIRGDKQAGMLLADETDKQLNIPVFSLYGKNKRPQQYMLEHLDVLIFDIQDLGVRFYTYLTTLIYAMEACARFGKKLMVLDRPNPLGGLKAEGGILQPGYESMVGAWSVPYQTGLTVGEFANLVNEEAAIGCDLHVVPLQNWRREMEFDETGLPWLPPSPNMPTIDTARVYPGMCLFEGTNLSEGRGTTKPFEWLGAPWLNAEKLCRCVNEAGLPGVRCHPTHFTPVFSKYKGELCHGVYLIVTDKKEYRPVVTALYLLHYIAVIHKDQLAWSQKPNEKPFIDMLSGSDMIRRFIAQPEGLQTILDHYDRDIQRWRERCGKYLLYT